MVNEVFLDFKQLLEPIEGDKPSGCYLKDDRAQYRALRNTFNAAQSSFRRFIETPDSSNDEELFEENQKNWQAVSDACWETLTEKSKDVEIYCWWVMSLVFQTDSINKISSSLATLTPFIETFWPNINPYLPDNKLKSTEVSEQNTERAELQLKPLIQLFGESSNSGLLYMPLQMIALVGDIDHTKYLSATKAGTLSALKNQAQNDFSSYQNDITETIKALDFGIKSVETFDAWLKAQISALSLPVISTQFLKNNLTDCLQAIKFLVEDSYQHWPLEQKKTIEVADESIQQTVSTNIDREINAEVGQSPTINKQQTAFIDPGNQTMNRDSAFHELRKIAEYFAKSEPHSPVSFLLEKAIRWGYMSLPDLMEELVSGNDKVLGQINLVTGISGEKAELPAYKQTAPTSDNNSTDAKVSAINDKVNTNSNAELSTSASGETSPINSVSPLENTGNDEEEEFSW
jgi:type VI secretion system protein ImpA